MSAILTVVFTAWRKTGRVDLEAIEMLVRGSMHQAGAKTLSHLLSMSGPRLAKVPCACGQAARYYDTRPKQLLTDVVGMECSPGVRRMMAVVGQ